MKWMKNNAIAISIALFVIGMSLMLHANEYEMTTKVVSTIVDGEITSNTIYSLDQSKPFLSILSNVFLSLAMALFISAFFIRHIEGDEKKAFEEKLLNFQEETAKDAIQSVFKRIIDEDFFSIIKKELLNAKAIRKNANWQYDISENKEGLLLKRTVSYEFHNISQHTTTEHIKLKGNNNEHCETTVISGKIRHPNGDEEPIELTKSPEVGDSFTMLEKEIKISSDESIEVVLVFQQKFKNGYIYETHTSGHPIINLEITVNFPSNYDFSLFSMFSNQERLRINEPDKKVYVVKGAIFKGQGIEFVCRKKVS